MASRTDKSARNAAPAKRAGAGLSIVVPLFNESAGLATLHQRLVTAAKALRKSRGLAVEIVYVDDGSGDDTMKIARKLPAKGADLQIVSLSRNFGKEAALLAGLEYARHSALLFMDGDGQHPPELIERLVTLWHVDGNDVVYTVKAHRSNESATFRLLAKLFYRLLNYGARQPIPEDAGDFRLLSPRAAEALKRMPERNRFFKGLSSWIGFRQAGVPYEPPARMHGHSSWNFPALVGLSIEGLTAFSTTPLRIASLLGILLAASALVFGLWTLGETFIVGRDVPGYPSVMIGIMVIGGAQLIVLGVLGEYIGKILSELKARPVYFVAEHERREASE
ncbi:MAG TPA: glycosyltransferase family 2 protein [Xanthobacteraceae bacterium]